MPRGTVTAPSVDPDEVARFAALAGAWWDAEGKFRPLHRLNPVRLAFIRDRVPAHFGRDALADRPLAGLRLLDIGCGGGLLCEPMARLGAEVVGVDAAAETVEAARLHAEGSGLTIDYRCGAAEDLAGSGERFDVVLNMEVVEHVADVDSFIGACCRLVAPGGLMIVATLNRTPKSFLLAVVGAEYVLRWLPRGTHDWRKFVRPSELATALGRCGFEIRKFSGVAYNPLNDKWSLGRNLDVNYMALATRMGATRMGGK